MAERGSGRARFWLPALAVAVLALMAGVAIGSTGARGLLSSQQARGAALVPTAKDSRFARVLQRKSAKRGPRGPRGRRGARGRQGPRGYTGSQGPSGQQGPAGTSGDQVYSFSLNWQGQAGDPGPGATTTALAIPGIGTLAVSCPWAFDAANTSGAMTFAPAADNAATRGVAAYTTLQGAGTSGAASYYRLLSTQASPIPIGYTGTPGDFGSYYLPPNGMITGTLGIEPFAGNGGSGPPPATFTLSSEYVANDPVDTNRFCHVSGQVISHVG